MNKIFNYNGNNYLVKLTKSVLSFLNENNNIDEYLINSWRDALQCHIVVVYNDNVLFLTEIEEAQIID